MIIFGFITNFETGFLTLNELVYTKLYNLIFEYIGSKQENSSLLNYGFSILIVLYLIHYLFYFLKIKSNQNNIHYYCILLFTKHLVNYDKTHLI